MADIIYQATGRRKTSVARVTMRPGSGEIKVNGRDLDDYFSYDTLKIIAKAPLKLTENESNYDIKVNVQGGGFNGQAGAIRHAIARVLLEVNPDYRQALKRAGFLTRDPRKKKDTNTVKRKQENLHNSQKDKKYFTNKEFLFLVFLWGKSKVFLCKRNLFWKGSVKIFIFKNFY